MSGLERLLRAMVGAFTAAGIPYMLTGSLASTVYGAPRTTYGVEFVVDPPDPAALEMMANRLTPEFYVDAGAVSEAWRQRRVFNIVDSAGWKADCILRKERAFSREEFGCRRQLEVLGVALAVASAEDVILSKLEWSQESGGSERQRRDVAAILAGAGGGLDRDYLRHWRGALGLEREWALATGADAEP